MNASYAASPIKRARRTKAEMEGLRAALHKIVKAQQPMTVRQVFYQAVVAALIPKTEAAYNDIVVRLLTEMRRNKELPYEWLSDNTRWFRLPRTYNSPEDFQIETARLYRRNLWADAECYVEIWCEKEALAGVILEETYPLAVSLAVTRGFSSESYLHAAANQIAAVGKPTFIYQFGDHDPSGVWVSKKIEEGLRRLAPGSEIHYIRAAVTPEQIERYELPTRPTKRHGNAHAKGFRGRSVELDAFAPRTLRRLVRQAIMRHIDKRELKVLLAAEKSERENLVIMAELLAGR